MRSVMFTRSCFTAHCKRGTSGMAARCLTHGTKNRETKDSGGITAPVFVEGSEIYMSKNKLTQEEERAELEYYEKLGRKTRWKNIEHMFVNVQKRLREYLQDYCESLNENRGEEYLSRVREERIMLRDLLIEMERLNETVSDGVSKYTTEEPNRPNWLP